MIDSITNSNQQKLNQPAKPGRAKVLYLVLGLFLGAFGGFYAGVDLMKTRANKELASFKDEVSKSLEELRKENSTATANIYFFNEAGSLVPVTRTITVAENIEKTLVLVQFAGLNSEETAAGLKSYIPSNANLKDIQVENGTASLSVQDLGSGEGLAKAKEQITAALKSLGIKQVNFDSTAE